MNPAAEDPRAQAALRGHPLFARMYARMTPGMDRGGLAEHRARLLVGLSGTVVEIGCGNGRNFAHYPAAVVRVLAIEPDPYLRRLAEQAAAEASVPIEVGVGTAQHLPAEDASFDAAVTSLVLCSVGDQHAVLREIHRVLRPGGQLRFLEHVQAAGPGSRRYQRVLDATIRPRLTGGCRTSCDTEAAIRAAGFAVSDIERFNLPSRGSLDPTAPHIRGAAERS